MDQRPPKLSRRIRYDRVRVGESRHGKGVFATVPLKGKRPVGRIHGTIKPPGYLSEYCMGFRDGGIEPDEPYRRVNHSCDPNCELIEWEITNEETGEKVYELWLHTVRDIDAGEELTIDYAWDWRAAIPCECGSPNCRGWIVKPEELEICVRERGKGSRSR